MFTLAKLKIKKFRAPSLQAIMQGLLVTIALLLGIGSYAQSAVCAANETVQSYTFAAPNNWPAGAPNIGYTIGAGASSVTVTGVASLNDIVAGNPTTAPSGGFANAYYYLIDRTSPAGINTVTLTFSKPINNLQLVATDIDTFTVTGAGGGTYQDQVTILGNGPTGLVTPTAVATSALVAIASNVATAAGTAAQNCAAGSNLCNATFSFSQPVTSVTYSYGNGPAGAGNPPNQAVGLAALGFCVQNPDLSLVKNDGGLSFTAGTTGTYSFAVSNAGSAATSGTTTVKDILPAGMSFVTPLTPGGANAAAWICAVSTTTNANDTATCTSTTAIAAAGSSTFTLPVAVAATATGTLTNRAKVFGGGDPNKVAETTTGAISACPSDSLAGAVANAGCGFETTPIIPTASVIISKTDSKAVATAGGTNAYVVTLTNQGPSAANGVIVTDVVGAGLTCPAANAVTCTVTGVGALCPTGPLTIASLTAGVAVATLPPAGALQFAYTCNVN